MSILSEIGNLNLSSLSSTTVTQTFWDLAVSIPDIAWICGTVIVLALILKPVAMAIVQEFKRARHCNGKFQDIEVRLQQLERRD